MSISDDEYAPPKYAQIVQAIRRKIADGTYPPGSQLPSETQLVREFAVSRPTVVRALQVLQLRGVIDREHGKGSFVKPAPPAAEEDSSRPGRAVLDRVETREGATILEAGSRPAPANVAAMFSLPESAPVVMRRVLFADAGKPCELVTFWCPIELAEGTDLGGMEPLTVGVRQHMQRIKGVKLDHVIERLAARHPLPEEIKALGLAKTTAVLAVLSRIFDGSGRPVLIIEVALPGTLHELEDAYSL
ncbi:GntR family transcriptional regulator [Planobispora longispora]|uniref:GntR family transcriptional regulator n=1 Tax=Planobispora longispora TaxID=28887 RepID=A0A8J3W7M6_9ACTN|nr:GntR family transcriptional regulator [Planobispora longispora]BFE84228.1 GntR family transcriptional regulator [Planobispora longispora]GIH79010.1 GntR family transcriptional regulator [Planobispora longispora]